MSDNDGWRKPWRCGAPARWRCGLHGGTKSVCRHISTPTLKSV